jgi:IPT/TIG domain
MDGVRGDAGPGERRRWPASWLAHALVLCVTLVCSLLAGPALASAGAAPHASFRVQRLCGARPRPGTAACMALKLVPDALSASALHAAAVRQSREARGGLRPAVGDAAPIAGYLTPQSLHAAYALPSEASSGPTQTIAVVDAFDDPTAEADLAVYDAQFGLPACTSANGCFRKLNQQGTSAPLPAVEGEWAGEISIDVQMAHAICEGCHILLVEADSEEFSDLGAALDTAVKAGATEISNSYAGPEEAGDAELAKSSYDHPGVVVTAASGDCGYLNEACGWEALANFPADSPDVVAVGGTKLSNSKAGWKSTVWKDGGSGCSTVFSAPLWQSAMADFAATGCGVGRAVADVSAIGDPDTGVDVYDSTPEGNGDPTGWGVWGGTSVASPIIAAEFALAGGAHGVSDPAATLYSHLGDSGALYDVLAGANGSCAGASICAAASGYDGPSGVGSPLGLGAFATGASPVGLSPPTITGIAQVGQVLTEHHGEWSNDPASFKLAWELCDAAGKRCAPIASAGGQSYTLTAADVGSTIRVQETAANAAGAGTPMISTQTAAVTTDVPGITGLTPSSAITGSAIEITGSGLGETTAVHFGALSAHFTALSGTEVEAIVPDGAKSGKVTLTTPLGTLRSKAKFTPTLSLVSFSPTGGAPGSLVKLKGIGFDPGAEVSFGGVPATEVTYLSASKLTAVVPPGASSGVIIVTNGAQPTGSVSSAAGYTVG